MIARSFAARLAVCSFLAMPAAIVATACVPAVASAASEVKVVVNKQPITTYQIQQRAAFLKLRRTPGGNDAATDELIDEMLKRQEIARRRIAIPDAAVDEAYGNFAKSNKLTTEQLSQVLGRAGFSEKAFKDYIRVQMGWGQAVVANVRQKDRLTEQDVVQRMLSQGGQKPKTTEYTLQQVIFVVPNDKRGAQLDRRMSEANGLRQRFTNCAATYDIAKGLRDVTVRDLGRVAEPELPPRWKKDIMASSKGRATAPQATERGVELIGICDTRTVSDDQTAAMVFQEKDLEAMGKKEPDKDFLAELKKKATIVRR